MPHRTRKTWQFVYHNRVRTKQKDNTFRSIIFTHTHKHYLKLAAREAAACLCLCDAELRLCAATARCFAAPTMYATKILTYLKRGGVEHACTMRIRSQHRKIVLCFSPRLRLLPVLPVLVFACAGVRACRSTASVLSGAHRFAAKLHTGMCVCSRARAGQAFRTICLCC